MDNSTSNLGPIYRIHTDRLVIRCWEPADAPLLKKAVDESREHLKPWMGWARGEPEEVQVIINRLRSFRGMFDKGDDYIYGIFDRDEKNVLGGTGLHTRLGEGAREIGYWIHQNHIGQGLATESSAALVKVAFEVDGVNRVEIHCDPGNLGSAAIPKKLGFEMEAVLKQRLRLGDHWRDTMIWTLFRDEYPSSPSACAAIEAYDVVGRRVL